MRILQLLLLGSIFSLFPLRWLQAGELTGKLLIDGKESELVGVTFQTREFALTQSCKVVCSKDYVSVEGRFSRANWSLALFREGKQSGSTRGGEFRFLVPIEVQETPIEFVEVGPYGEIQRVPARISFPGWAIGPEPEPVQRFQFLPGLGLTYRMYEQTLISSFHQWELDGRFSALYLLAPNRWDIGLTIESTLGVLSNSQSTWPKPSFFGLNLRAGYLVPAFKDGMRLSLMAGIYYTTMFGTQDLYGYFNKIAPEVFPVFHWDIGHAEVLKVQLKFSPISDGVRLLTLSNREIAVGLGWIHPLRNRHNLLFDLDHSNLHLNFQGRMVQTSATSLSLGYEL